MTEPSQLACRIEQILAAHVGSILAQTTVRHCCKELGISAGELTYLQLFEFAGIMHKRLMPFLGPEASAGLAERVRQLQG